MTFAWQLGETADVIARGTIIERAECADGPKYQLQVGARRRIWVEEEYLFALDDYADGEGLDGNGDAAKENGNG